MDKKLWQIIKKEIQRQEETLELIPSENFVDLETLFIVGSPLINKYAEGYPGKRYYPGNKFIDEIENLAKERALKAFRLNQDDWAVNVQSYSGSPANLAVYLALAEPGETIMGLNLFHGGHLTHGHKVSYTGKLFKSVQYGINPQTETIDYGELEKLALEYKPKIVISGTTAYPRIIDFKVIYQIAKKVNAYHIADISHIAGLVNADLHPSPFYFADVVTMTTHKTLKGPRGAVIFMRKELEEKINKSIFPGLQGGPHMQTIAGIAYAFGRALKKDFYNYQKQIIKNTKTLAEELKKIGFKLYTNGTDNHLMIIDLKPLNLDGKTAENLLERANIIANRNSLPSDTSPFNPTGIRVGTPAVTSRGMKEKEMKLMAEFFERILIRKEKPEKIKKEVIKLTKKFPLNYIKWIKNIQRIL
ncbi:MAG: serine hydroxymethyltransferase [Candidatus Parcubacteria bacterium]|nr:MAG: serine hydroxymethyltransferase [Candidatus Parcubacteria bacterium]